MRVFVDTSALVALAEPRDGHHVQARKELERLARTATLFTSDYVLDETLTRLQRLSGPAVALRVGEALLSSTLARMVHVEERDVEEAWKTFRKFADQALSFTDCAILAVARRLKVEAVFTFDAGFLKAGVRVLPALRR